MLLKTRRQCYFMVVGQLLQFGYLQFLLVPSTQFLWYVDQWNKIIIILKDCFKNVPSLSSAIGFCIVKIEILSLIDLFCGLVQPSQSLMFLPLPQLPKILELVGLGYTGWFVYRYLLFKVRSWDWVTYSLNISKFLVCLLLPSLEGKIAGLGYMFS